MWIHLAYLVNLSNWKGKGDVRFNSDVYVSALFLIPSSLGTKVSLRLCLLLFLERCTNPRLGSVTDALEVFKMLPDSH